jgi:hypothetical protein
MPPDHSHTPLPSTADVHVPVLLTLPGLIDSIITNVHVGVGDRLFNVQHCLPARGKCRSLIPTTELADYHVQYSSPWHRPSTSHSRGFPPPTKRCSITQSWSRKRSQTTGATMAAMKRRIIVGSMRRGPHKRIVDSIDLSCACDLGNACHFGFGRVVPLKPERDLWSGIQRPMSIHRQPAGQVAFEVLTGSSASG